MKTIILILVSVTLSSMVYADGQINIAYVPYTINTPGSYIVVKDLYTTSNQTAISISTSNVTIDLNGHTLYGAGTSIPSSGYGIFAVSATNNVSIFNGTVRDFRMDGITLNGDNNHVSHIRAYGNGEYGICFSVSNTNSLVLENTAEYNASDGINALFNTGVIIRNNAATFNGRYGISVGNGCTISGNSMTSNGSDGLYAGTGCIINGNSAYFNTGNGIQSGNSCLVSGNNCRNNSGNGIRLKNGVYYSQVIGNNCAENNNGAGILLPFSTNTSNAIMNNTLFGNATGLSIQGAGNFSSGNIIRSNSISTSIVAGNTAGDGTNGGFNDLIVP